MISQEIQTLLNNKSIEFSSLNLEAIENKIYKADRLYNFANNDVITAVREAGF